MQLDIVMKFKAVILNGEIVASISKNDWVIDDLEGMYIIRKK
jgi:hypothetical protein